MRVPRTARPDSDEEAKIEAVDLIADIGATNSRCALLDESGTLRAPEAFGNADFAGVEALLEGYLERCAGRERPRRAALAIAAPVFADRVRMINRDWAFSQSGLARRLGVHELFVVNDFAALARALPELGADGLYRVGTGEPAPGQAKAVLGPGSGLGVAGLVPAAGDWAVVGGEGGHVTLPAADDAEQAVVSALRERHGHCSAEMLLSGPGLVRLYSTLAEIGGRAAEHLAPEEVTARAIQGEPLEARVLEVFFRMLGTVASNLALTLGARGGVYIGGGIVPGLVDAIDASGFRQRFVDKGAYRDYLESIPTFVITAPLPALAGLRALLRHG